MCRIDNLKALQVEEKGIFCVTGAYMLKTGGNIVFARACSARLGDHPF